MFKWQIFSTHIDQVSLYFLGDHYIGINTLEGLIFALYPWLPSTEIIFQASFFPISPTLSTSFFLKFYLESPWMWCERCSETAPIVFFFNDIDGM